MHNMTTAQSNALDQLRTSGLARYTWANEIGVASFARGDFGSMGSAAKTGIQNFLEDFGQPFGPADVPEAAQFVRMREDSLGWRHYEYRQTYPLPDASGSVSGSAPSNTQPRRLDVDGAFLSFHVDAGGRLVEIQSSFWRDVFVLPENPIALDAARRQLASALAYAAGAAGLVANRGRAVLDRVAMLGRPTLVVFPHRGGFRLAWRIRAAVSGPHGFGGGPAVLLPGVIFLDAVTGERLWEGITASDAETPDVGSGLSNLPFGGPHQNRPLQIVRVDMSASYRLRDTTHSREIVTYDWDGDLPNYFETADLLSDGSVEVSSDTDGDKNWNDIAADDSEAALSASQQTEVDAHFNAERVYEWYDAIAGAGGREGFDDGNYGGQVPSNMPVHLLAHVGVDNAQFHMMSNDSSEEVSYLSFSDATSEAGHQAWAASPLVVCHEYQHGITAHSVGGIAPGFPSGFYGWARALTEGLSDVFGGMFSGQWYAGADLSPAGQMFRNLAFPRDPDTTGTSLGKDHWADRDSDSEDLLPYPHGHILAHCAYLMAQGGVHQRSGRTPELIPVHPLESEESGGLEVSVAARVWYRVMATRFASITPYNSETVFEKVRTECEASAIDLYGEGSPAHRCTVQAFYAVGMHPAGETYGADVTALRWGYSWRFSRPYIGIPSPNWASPDLFINNGGTSDWNAIINPGFGDVHFENAVYCRVRNIGELAATNIVVNFEYAKYGTAPVFWSPMRDAALVAQELAIGSLAAGGENFGMEDQDSPPETARVLWSVPALSTGDEVDHYCIRATMSADNDVNPHNGTIQSNVAYTVLGTMRMSRAFNIGNPTERPLRPDLKLTTTLPVGWRVRIREDLGRMLLPPQTEHTVHVDIERPEGSSPDDHTRCSPPFDGEVRGKLCGLLCGTVRGTFTNVRGSAVGLTGTIALRIDGGGLLTGRFKGRLDCGCGELSGNVEGVVQCGTEPRRLCAQLTACLRPFRLVEIQQFDGARTLGGITLQFQVPMPENCRWPNAPTDTHNSPEPCDERLPTHTGSYEEDKDTSPRTARSGKRSVRKNRQ